MTTSQKINDALLQIQVDQDLITPAYVYNETEIEKNLGFLEILRKNSGCNILYSLKAMSCRGLLEKIAGSVDGFSASSLFESRYAREILGNNGTVHLTSPGIREAEITELAQYCDYISFNSLSQWQRFKELTRGVNNGLRINPEKSYLPDIRFDPCRPASKLGVPLSGLPAISENASLYEGLSGFHIHNNYESTNFAELVETLEIIKQQHRDLFESLQWLNLGGGYLLEEKSSLDFLADKISALREKYSLDVFFEPGKAIVGKAGYLVASVIDLFRSGDIDIAVLDTSVSHLPEVFEYQYHPWVTGDTPDGKYTYHLAGASCLSGDIFGEYTFARPLETGSRIIFANVGAYMMVKANMFNGINLPAVYSINREKEVILHKQYDYSDYRNRL